MKAKRQETDWRKVHALTIGIRFDWQFEQEHDGPRKKTRKKRQTNTDILASKARNSFGTQSNNASIWKMLLNSIQQISNWISIDSMKGFLILANINEHQRKQHQQQNCQKFELICTTSNGTDCKARRRWQTNKHSDNEKAMIKNRQQIDFNVNCFALCVFVFVHVPACECCSNTFSSSFLDSFMFFCVTTWIFTTLVRAGIGWRFSKSDEVGFPQQAFDFRFNKELLIKRPAFAFGLNASDQEVPFWIGLVAEICRAGIRLCSL